MDEQTLSDSKNAIVSLMKSMQNVSLSGERGGPSAQQMVESRIHYVNQKG